MNVFTSVQVFSRVGSGFGTAQDGEREIKREGCGLQRV